MNLATAKSAIDIQYSKPKPKLFAGEICDGICWGVSPERTDRRVGVHGERFAEENAYLDEAMDVVMGQWTRGDLT